jgi:hypothetical protein
MGGQQQVAVRVRGCLISGSSEMTMGSRRTLLRPTASAVSTGVAPAPSADTRITCAGPAHTSTVEAASHHRLKPKSCASAAMPI